MKIRLNKKEFMSSFLEPICKVAEEGTINFNANSVYAVVSDTGGVNILYSKLCTTTGLGGDSTIQLNFKNFRKFAKIIECIPEDDFDLTVNDTVSLMSYKSPGVSFKVHLLDESIIKRCSVNIDKILALTFDTSFQASHEKLQEMVRGVFLTDSNKAYFSTKNGCVYSEITDMAVQDTDSISYLVADKYEGKDISNPLPFDIDVIRTINSIKADTITVKINNTLKILLFDITSERRSCKLIVPCRIK